MSAKSLIKIFLFSLISLSGNSIFAQDASRVYVEQTGWAIGTYFGLTDLWGDVGTKSPIEHYINGKYFDKVCFMGGLMGRYTIHPALAVRLSTGFGTFYATDQWNSRLKDLNSTQREDALQRFNRGQNAKPDIFENSMILEFTPFRLNPESRRATNRGQLYFGLGLSYFHYTPKSTVGNSNTWVETYDLHLEGDGFGDKYPKEYSLWAVSIPMLVGYRFDLGKHLNLGFEFNFRKTFTDHLDGVSGKYIDPNEYKNHMSSDKASTAYAVEDKGYLVNPYVHPFNVGTMRGIGSGTDNYSTFSVSLYFKVHEVTKQWWKQL